MRKKKVEPEKEDTKLIYEAPPEIDQLEIKDKKPSPAEVEIIPLRDFPQGIHQNEINIDIKEGVPVTIPRRFLQNLVTEKVIKNIPK